ncbi:MAG: plastocyanin/azurin family copper-binding protein [Thermoplasmatota archaeon]
MRALLPALLLALALAGCTGNTQDTIAPQPQDTGNAPASGTAASTQTPATTASGTSTAGPRAAKTFNVDIQGNAFVGGTLTIQKGDTVHWVHKDGTTPHSVASDDGKFSSDGGVACPGAGCMTSLAHSTFDFTFGEVGNFHYHCEVHPSMTGVITVVQSQTA